MHLKVNVPRMLNHTYKHQAENFYDYHLVIVILISTFVQDFNTSCINEIFMFFFIRALHAILKVVNVQKTLKVVKAKPLRKKLRLRRNISHVEEEEL